jgi:DNA-binding MarR family transcriptional regulator
MSTSRPSLAPDRMAIGQIVGRLLHHFRDQMFDNPERAERFPGVRYPHLQIWGNVGIDGIRLTELAERATLSLAACSELVNEMQAAGYLERRPDPSDRRAKLLFPTPRGRALLDEAGHMVAEIEEHWRSLCPPGAFDQACKTFDDLLEVFNDEPRS